jgi:hypothetical protein
VISPSATLARHRVGVDKIVEVYDYCDAGEVLFQICRFFPKLLSEGSHRR